MNILSGKGLPQAGGGRLHWCAAIAALLFVFAATPALGLDIIDGNIAPGMNSIVDASTNLVNGTATGGNITVKLISGQLEFGARTQATAFVSDLGFGGIAGGLATGTSSVASNNTVTLESGSFVNTMQWSGIYGGFAGRSDTTNPVSGASENSVIITGGAWDKSDIYIAGAYVVGGYATLNSVVFTGGTVGGRLVGGGTITSGTASYNTVTIGGTAVVTATSVTPDYALVAGGIGADGANNNTVTIESGATIGTVGGNAHRIVGGAAYNGKTSRNNTVNIHEGAVLAANVGIYGGHGYLPGSGHVVTTEGNTLNLKGYTGTISKLGGFDNLNFYFPNNITAGSTILTVTDEADLGSATTVRIGGVSSASAANFNGGDQITLIDATGATAFTGDIESIGSLTDGFTYEWNVNVEVADQKVVATLGEGEDGNGSGNGGGKKTREEGKSLNSGMSAGVATLRHGGDLVVGTGMSNLLGAFTMLDNAVASGTISSADAVASMRGGSGGWSGPVLFAAVDGGHYTYDADTDIDMNGVSYLTGFGWRNRGHAGALVVGAFFEGGYSHFDNNAFYGESYIGSEGQNRYYGGGIVGRFDWNNGLYAEGSFRAGGIKTKYDNKIHSGGQAGNSLTYDVTSGYLGAHAGLGYKLNLPACSVLDISGKYLWTRQGSDSAYILNDTYEFDSANSHRARVGARYTYNVQSRFSPYVGASYEYEFDGEVRTSNSMVNYGTPTMKGSSGICELGVSYKQGNFVADLGVQGHVGKRKGVSGSLNVGWNF